MTKHPSRDRDDGDDDDDDDDEDDDDDDDDDDDSCYADHCCYRGFVMLTFRSS